MLIENHTGVNKPLDFTGIMVKHLEEIMGLLNASGLDTSDATVIGLCPVIPFDLEDGRYYFCLDGSRDVVSNQYRKVDVNCLGLNGHQLIAIIRAFDLTGD